MSVSILLQCLTKENSDFAKKENRNLFPFYEGAVSVPQSRFTSGVSDHSWLSSSGCRVTIYKHGDTVNMIWKNKEPADTPVPNFLKNDHVNYQID